MRSTDIQVLRFALATTLCLAALGTRAQAVELPVLSGGTLVMSSPSTVTDNVLAPAASTFAFSGALADGVSAAGYYYADYLITVSAASAESVTTTLTNFGGVSNLSERIYTYGGSFLGDARPPTGALQAWSTDYPLPGASVSVISPTTLTAGQYVVELRGTSAGTFGGSLSLAPVPEPLGVSLAFLGFGALRLMAVRRRKGNAC